MAVEAADWTKKPVQQMEQALNVAEFALAQEVLRTDMASTKKQHLNKALESDAKK